MEKEARFSTENAVQEQQDAENLAEAFAGSSPSDRKRLSRIVDLLPCYVALIDKNHRILFHNKTFEEYFGAPKGSPCHRILRGNDVPCRFCPPLDVLSNKGATVMEWVHPKTGHAFRVYSYAFTEDNGDSCILEAGFNVTANVRVQQALDLSEQSYRTITDNLSIGIALVDPSLRIKTGNVRLSQWFAEGFRLDRRVCDLLQCGEAWEQAVGKEGFTCPDCPFQQALKDASTHERELTVTFQDGVERSVRLVTCPVAPGAPQNKKRRVRALIMMLEDITNRLKVNQQLQRARKLEAMSTLAGGIAHEINQPLSALHLYASGLQMLLEKQDVLPSQTTQKRLSLIMREADKIRSIISHMRTLVMQEGPLPLTSVSLAKCVDDVLSIMKHQVASRGVTIRVEMPKRLPSVRCNEVQLEQVLVNLVGNAIHALDSDESREKKQRRSILIRASLPQENKSVRLEVADSGPGLPKGGERIFDPFYTTKERHEGMGLGLSIVHGLVSLWGAQISASPHHPELGGAVFTVDLPLAEEETVAGNTEETGAGQSGTIYQFYSMGRNAAPEPANTAPSSREDSGDT